MTIAKYFQKNIKKFLLFILIDSRISCGAQINCKIKHRREVENLFFILSTFLTPRNKKENTKPPHKKEKLQNCD